MTLLPRDPLLELERWPARYGSSALLFCAYGIAAMSCVVLSAISLRLFLLQLAWIGLGSVILLFSSLLDWRKAAINKSFVWGLYAGALALLFAAFVQGYVIRGTHSWLDLGPLNLQPVELAKVALVLLFARYFAKAHAGVAKIRHISASFALFALPAVLTALQPDLGSALILFGIWFSFLLLSGLPRRQIAGMTALIAVVLVALWFLGLKEYQRERIIGVFYPERDILGINYSVSQSKVAVGSGGLWGKGYGQGTQTQLDFLPEPATDFIFPALVEEWGFAGGVTVLALFVGLIFNILKAGFAAEGNFEKLLCLGAATVFGLQFMVNLGSSLGLLPVVGVTFPFLSYGGSSMVANFFIIALVYAISHRK